MTTLEEIQALRGEKTAPVPEPVPEPAPNDTLAQIRALRGETAPGPAPAPEPEQEDTLAQIRALRGEAEEEPLPGAPVESPRAFPKNAAKPISAGTISRQKARVRRQERAMRKAGMPEEAAELREKRLAVDTPAEHSSLAEASGVLDTLDKYLGAPDRALAGGVYALQKGLPIGETLWKSVTREDRKSMKDVIIASEEARANKYGMTLDQWKEAIAKSMPGDWDADDVDTFWGVMGGAADAVTSPLNVLPGPGAVLKGAGKVAGKVVAPLAKVERLAKAGKAIAEPVREGAAAVRAKFSHLDKLASWKDSADPVKVELYKFVNQSHNQMLSPQLENEMSQKLGGALKGMAKGKPIKERLTLLARGLSPEDQALITNAIESGEAVPEALAPVVTAFKEVLGEMKTRGEAAGYLKGTVDKFAPHVMRKERLGEKAKRFLGGEDKRSVLEMGKRQEPQGGTFSAKGYAPDEARQMVDKINAAVAGTGEVALKDTVSDINRYFTAKNGRKMFEEDPVRYMDTYLRVASKGIQRIEHEQRIINQLMMSAKPLIRGVLKEGDTLRTLDSGLAKVDELTARNHGLQKVVLKDSREFFVPEEVASYFASLDKIGKVPDALKGLRAFNSVWKPLALATPGYHMRNVFSNNIQMLQGYGIDAFRPDVLKAGLAAAWKKGVSATFKLPNGQKVPVKDLRALLEKNNLWNPDILGVDALGRGMGLRDLPVLKQMNRAGTVFENEARMRAFLAGLGNDATAEGIKKALAGGMDPAAYKAMERVREFLFDYGQLSNTEANVLRQIFPWYAWSSKNISLQLKLLANHPQWAVRWLGAGMNAEEAEKRPGYIAAGGGIPLPGLDLPKTMRAALMPEVPMRDLKMLDTGAKEMMLTGFTNMNPLLQVPSEVVFGKQAFSGAPLPIDADGSIAVTQMLIDKFGSGPVYHLRKMMEDPDPQTAEAAKKRFRELSFLAGVKIQPYDRNLAKSQSLRRIDEVGGQRVAQQKKNQ